MIDPKPPLLSIIEYRLGEQIPLEAAKPITVDLSPGVAPESAQMSLL